MATQSMNVLIRIDSDTRDVEDNTTTTKVVFDVLYKRVVEIAGESDVAPQSGNSTTTTTPAANNPQGSPKFVNITETLRSELDTSFKGTATINDVASSSTIQVNFLGFDGRELVVKSFNTSDIEEGELFIQLNRQEIESLVKTLPSPETVVPPILRDGIFVPIGFPPGSFNFPSMMFQVAPIDYDDESWKVKGLEELFNAPFESNSIVVNGLPAVVKNWSWRSIRVAVDGTFSAKFSDDETKNMKGWGWMLAGKAKSTYIGVIVETVTRGLMPRSIILDGTSEGDDGGHQPVDKTPPSTEDCQCDDKQRKPTEVSEAELANNPGVYTEDPGSFCKPFSNPERVLSEHSFFTVLRVEAPVISAEASKELEEPALIDFDPPEEMLENINAEPIDYGVADLGTRLQSLALARSIRLDPSIMEPKPLISGAAIFNKINQNTSVITPFFPPGFDNIFNQMDRGRKEMDASNPVQWDSHSLRYQATTVAVGHILEFRVRTRSNGYSLGGVAKTLTLAPRQTMRKPSLSNHHDRRLITMYRYSKGPVVQN
jgi:hypothetical protein